MEGTGRLFFRQEPALASRFTVAIYSLPRNPPFEYQQMIDDILEIMSKEGFSKATIAGESFGGTVALHFALEHPECVEQLILINTFPYYRNRFKLWLGSTLLPLAYTRFTRVCWDAMLKKILQRELLDSEGISKLMECSFSQGLATGRERWRLVRSHDVRERLSEIQAPVILIAAKKDKVVPSVLEAELMAKKMKNSRIVILPKHGHTCLITDSFLLASVI